MEFLEVTFSRNSMFKLLCDTYLALARSSPTRRYTGKYIPCIPILRCVCGMSSRAVTSVIDGCRRSYADPVLLLDGSNMWFTETCLSSETQAAKLFVKRQHSTGFNQ